jgi:adenylate cyclase
MGSHRLSIRIACALVLVLLGALHATGSVRWSAFDALDRLIYDTRLRFMATKPMDERIVIVDIDPKSLAALGPWPWPRNRLAQLTNELFDTQSVAVVGFDIVFSAPDTSTGLAHLRQLADGALADWPAYPDELARLAPALDFDGQFAQALANRPVVLGHYFNHDVSARYGQLPPPVMPAGALGKAGAEVLQWTGYGGNLPLLADAAAAAGYFNAITDADGVVRALPLVAQFDGAYYPSLALAVLRLVLGGGTVEPGFPSDRFLPLGYSGLESLVLRQGSNQLALPVDNRAAAWIPFRGRGGPAGGSFRYVSAVDVLQQQLLPQQLQGKIVLVGTSAPGLLDLHRTPVGAAYPGVEAHANLIAGFLDGEVPTTPDYAIGYELAVVVLVGLILAVALPWLSTRASVALSAALLLAVVGLNTWLFVGADLVLPLAASVWVVVVVFVLNMVLGYGFDRYTNRVSTRCFGPHLAPDAIQAMEPTLNHKLLRAQSRELTVLFCDIHNVNALANTLPPQQLQALLKRVFTELTQAVWAQRGSVEQAMGGRGMAFWGAPVACGDHAALAVQAALDIRRALHALNQERALQGWPAVDMGMGICTGTVLVGDMGSVFRRHYSVLGGAVQGASRLAGLSAMYGVDLLVGQTSREQANARVWQELDKVVLSDGGEAVACFTPRCPSRTNPTTGTDTALAQELALWARCLKAYRAQDWDACELALLNLARLFPQQPLYALYRLRVQQQRHSGFA